MKKVIAGTWFEFWHHNTCEGMYFNEVCRHFTEAQWRKKCQEIKDLGMDYVVVTASSMVYKEYAESYFETDIYPAPKGMVCKNPLDVLMDEMQKLHIKVFLSVGWYGVWDDTLNNMTSEEVTARAFKAIDQLYAKYKDNSSLYGWYLPDETHTNGCYNELFIAYVNKYARYLKRKNADKKILIAPYGTKDIIVDAHFVDQLKRLECDIVAYQDEVGARKSTTEQASNYFKNLKWAHDQAQKSALWADIEIYDFEKDLFTSGLVPANMARIKKQIEGVAPYVERILCYMTMGTMSKKESDCFCGRQDASLLYDAYQAYRKTQE